MSPTGSRHALITPDDQGLLLAIISWFLGATLVLCIAIRLAVRFTTRQLSASDDIIITIAAVSHSFPRNPSHISILSKLVVCKVSSSSTNIVKVLAVGSTIAVTLAVRSGLGKRSHLLDPETIPAIQKEMYAATILYVLSIGMSKMSITTFLARLTRTTTQKTVVLLLAIVTMPFWLSSTVVDVLIDLAIIFLPVHIVWTLEMHRRKKAAIIFIFALRFTLASISIVRLIYLIRFIGADPSFGSVPYGIATQCHSALSVVIACIPALKPFIENVQTGMLSASLSKHGPGAKFGEESYSLQALPSGSNRDAINSKRQDDLRPPSSSGGSKRFYLRRSESQPKFEYLQSEFGRIVKHPLTDLQSTSSSRPSTRASKPPRRPLPPPEELRPDMTRFLARARSISSPPRVSTLRTENARATGPSAESMWTRYSEDSGESESWMIKSARGRDGSKNVA
ncbi:hypothetical protein EJ04DRAFT_599587 [Polyplosphaeria fusca]|uniref:Rhodopsin domain-containing protein n=1 Tax=Polyplosphaeria fusca TaxID=682080 RepID=A0A9P4V4X4_9PLEO|nr:hypothetical protein EJ04DRAFT_599587 [Polyplosphaeria fusca]